MSDHNGSSAAGIATPVRNRFFYGKLMDVRHFEMEQLYFIERRRLMNRLALGEGVLCGLGVEATDDGRALLKAGAALDGRGREILVPAARCIEDPLQPTDDCGRPDGDPVTDGPVTLCLHYHECETEPTPVLVEDCDAREGCRPGAVQERYRLRIVRGRPDPPSGLSAEECAAIFPAEVAEGFDRRRAVCETISGPCPEGGDGCVPLAVFTAPAAGSRIGVETCSVRPRLLSNADLLDLILCLAARVDRCCSKPATPPVVRALLPPSAAVLSREDPDALADWLGRPRVEVTFDREMAADRLATPDPWLRVWFAVQSVPLTHVPPPFIIRLPVAAGIARAPATDGSVAVEFPLEHTAFLKGVLAAAAQGSRIGMRVAVLVQVRADDPATQIAAADGAVPALLDADFAGTALPAPLLDTIWDLPVDADGDGEPDVQAMVQELMAGFVDTGAPLPSGEGSAGGRMHAWFGLVIPRLTDVPPAVLAHWPPNGVALDRAGNDRAPAEWWVVWREAPRLEITFDREMDDAALNAHEAFLRMWQIVEFDGRAIVELVRLRRRALAGDPILAEPGWAAAYEPLDIRRTGRPTRYLVQIRSEGGAIPDTRGIELDADFAGTKLTPELLDTFWGIDKRVEIPLDAWTSLVETGLSLPRSGEGTPRGLFHLVFDVEEG